MESFYAMFIALAHMWQQKASSPPFHACPVPHMYQRHFISCEPHNHQKPCMDKTIFFPSWESFPYRRNWPSAKLSIFSLLIRNSNMLMNHLALEFTGRRGTFRPWLWCCLLKMSHTCKSIMVGWLDSAVVVGADKKGKTKRQQEKRSSLEIV